MSSIGKGIVNKRVLSVILNILLVCSLMFGPFSTVFAQSGETPTPEPTPLGTSTPTPELTNFPGDTLVPSLDPIDTPTVEPTAVPTEEPIITPTIDENQLFPEVEPSAFDWSTVTSQSPYPVLQPDTNYELFFTIKNTGSSTWRQADGYYLKNLSNPMGAGDRIELPYEIAPNQEITLAFNITTPSTPGSYNCGWMLAKNGLTFGTYMFIIVTVVQNNRLSAGSNHTCALTSSGGIKCWGGNFSGQLGDGTIITRLSPVDVIGLTSGVTAIATGISHSCALTTKGGIKCWGNNDFGQLGDGTTTTRLSPVDVIGLTSGVIAISPGWHHTCALTSGGGIKCWGENRYGKLGDGTTTTRFSPVDVIGLTSEVTAISTGISQSCAITSSEGIKCWGYNFGGQLGDGTTTERHSPVDVIGLTSGVVAITTGADHTCAITSNGGIKCWGYSSCGDLGDGTNTTRLLPVDVIGLTSEVTAIASRWHHSCGLTSSGGIKCWGGNFSGQLGDGTTAQRLSPVDVIGLTSGVTAITTGQNHTCALTTGGGIKCWGRNYEGQLGDGTTTDRQTPVDVIGLNGFIVSGNVLDLNGQPVEGVTISIQNGTTTATYSDGNYVLTGLSAGSYILTPSLNGASFSPPSQTINIVDTNLTNIDFVLNSEKYPIILLPGIMGSRLSNTPKSDPLCALRPQGEIWLDLLKFLIPPNALYLNPTSPTSANNCDKISPTGIMDSGQFDAYSQTIQKLEYAGYSVHPFAYDWRLSLEDSATKLDQFINENFDPSQKVILLGHSMGGLLARTYVGNSTRAAKIAQVITVGSPYWGAPVLALRMRSGILDNKFRLPNTDYYLALPQVANIARNSPGAMQLLPSESYINYSTDGNYYIDDQTQLTSWDAVKGFFISKTGKYGVQNAQLINESRSYHQNYDDLSSLPAGVDYQIITTSNRQTVSRIREYPCQFGPLPDTCFEEMQYVDGDGTVPYPSASIPGKAGSATVTTFNRTELGGLEHGNQMNDLTIINAILNLLKGAPAKAAILDSVSGLESTPQSLIQLVVMGDAEVSITDGSNQYLGLDSDGIVMNEIPGADYTLFEHQVIVVLPAGQAYTITLKQKGSYPLQVKVTDYLSPGTNEAYAPDQRAIFMDIPSSPDGVAVLPLDLSLGLDSLLLSLDQDNDGTPEQTLPPTSILDEVQSQDISMPVTTINLTGAKDGQDFYTDPMTAELSATDEGTGVLKTEYSLDGGETWLLYSTAVNFTAEDAQVFLARSVDIAGNQEYPWPSEQIRPFSISGTVINPGGISSAGVTIADGNGHTTTTDIDGNFTLNGLRSGTITITPSKTGWIFTPASHEVTLTISNVTGIDFEVNPTLPVIANMNPDMKYTGNPDFTLTVNGSGFVSTSVVRWNGADRSTTFVTPNQLTANISAGDIATAGTDIVSVFTPAPGGGTSNSVTFYKTGTGTGPAIPVLSVPIANANLSLRTPSLTVVAASKAVKYQYQVSPVATFDTLKVNEIVALTRYTITSAQALDWGYDYFWRVRSIDLSGKRSDWSAARKFTVTIQVSPVNGATFTSKRPIFKWFLSNTRLIHHIQISTDPGFTSLVLDKYTKPGSANTFSIALPNGTYYWRMRYKVADGWSVFMPFWTFTVNRK